MADRYWVGGTGNWDAATTTNWSTSTGGAGGASVPTSADNVIFDSASNATAYTVTITATANCLNFTMGAPASGAITWDGSSALNVYGSFSLNSGMTRSYTGTITFAATATSKTVATTGITLASNIDFNGVGGGWTISGAFVTGSSNSIKLTNGALDTGSQNITTGLLILVGTGTKSITAGTSTITISGSGTCWDFNNNSNFSWSGNSTNVSFTYAGASSRIAEFSNSTVNNITLSAGSGGFTLGNTIALGNVDCTGYTGALTAGPQVGGNFTMGTGMTTSFSAQTLTMTGTSGTKTITSNGVTWNNNVTFNGAATFQLADNFIQGTGNITRTTGTFDANGKTWTINNAGGCTINGGFTGTSSFYNLTRNGTAAFTDKLFFGASVTVSNTFTATGNSPIYRLIVQASIVGTPVTLTAATVTVTNTDFMDIIAAGAGNWNLSSGIIGDCGGNTGITFPTPANQYMKTASSVNWSASNWYTTSGGSTPGRVPLPQDTAIFDANSITAGSVVITQDMTRIPGFNFTNVANTPTLTTSTAAEVFGSIVLVAGMTLTGSTQAYTLRNRGTFGITCAGLSWAKAFTMDAPGGVCQPQDAFISTSTLTLTSGTFDGNGQTVQVTTFASSNSNVRTLTLGTGTWTLTSTGTVWNMATITNLTFNVTGSTIKITNNSATALTFAGGGATYNNVWFARSSGSGNITITGSSIFADIKDDGSVAHSILFTAGTVQTVTTFTVSGTAGQLISLNSVTAGTKFALRCASGSITRNYLSVKDSLVIGGATWTAGANSTFVSNNVGWSDLTDRYWVTGGDGNWNNTNNWSTTDGGASGASVPDGQNVYFTATSGAGGSAVNAVASCNNLNFTGFTGTLSGASALTVFGNLTIASGMTLSYTGAITFNTLETSKTINPNGKTFGSSMTFVNATGVGPDTWTFTDNLNIGAGTLTLTNGTLDFNNYNVTMFAFSSNTSNTRTVTRGSGTWTLTGNNTTLWNCSGAMTGMTISTGSPIICNYSGGTGTRTISGGTTESKVQSFNITAGTDSFTWTSGVKNIDFTGFAGTLTNAARTLWGNITVASGMTLTGGTQALTLSATSGTQVITSLSKNFDFPITFNGVGGTFQLADNLASGVATARGITLTAGTLDLNGKTLTNYGAYTIGSGSATRVIAFNAGSCVSTLNAAGSTTLWTYSGTNFSTTYVGGGTIKFDVNVVGQRTFIGGGASYPQLWFVNATSNGVLGITGSNTFTDIKCTAGPQSILFTAGTTQTVTSFTVSGTAGNLVTLNSTTTATFALVKSGGSTISCDYLNIQHSVATPSSTWYAGTHSTDNQAVATAGSGWTFTDVPVVATGRSYSIIIG